MRKHLIALLSLLCMALPMLAESGLKGTVVDAVTGKPIADANVMLRDQSIFVTTTTDGSFIIPNAAPGEDMLQVVAYGYSEAFVDVHILSGVTYNMGDIKMKESGFLEAYDSNEFIFDEEQINEDEGLSQSVGTIQGATDDVFYQAANYNFSVVYYKNRGLDNKWTTGYINGIDFSDPMRGQFSYSSLGGMTSTAFRSRTTTLGMDAAAYGFGSLNGSTNNTTYAGEYAPGFRGNVSYQNGAYMLRAVAQYSSGVNRHGWAFSGTVIGRYADRGVIPGTFYNSVGYSFSVQKIFNNQHSLNLTTWGAPTQRATGRASVQEAYDLTGDNLYNPSWGYFNGKRRSSRVTETFDPSVTLNWIWKPKMGTTLNTAFGFRHNAYSRTRLDYSGNNPDPDYYSKMPSYFYPDAEEGSALWEAQMSEYEQMAAMWKDQNRSVTQIDWDQIYQNNWLNRTSNDRNPELLGNASTILEKDHSNVTSYMLNSYLNHRISANNSLQGGLAFNYSDAHYFKTVDDLLGAEYWLDIDTYSERDFGIQDQDKMQNDLRNPNRRVKEGDTYGYDYNIRYFSTNLWAQDQINTTHWDLYYGLSANYTGVRRHGNMQNGRNPENSYGNGKYHNFMTAAGKLGVTYKLDGRNYFSLHAEGGNRNPLPYDIYVSARTKDDAAYDRDGDLKTQKYFSGDLSYTWNYPSFRGSITGFYTKMWDGMEHTGFYDYDLKSFMNYTLHGMTTEYKGITLGAEVKICTGLSATFAGTFSRYQYKNNPWGTRSYENGTQEDVTKQVFLKNYYLGNMPQQAYSLALKYNINMWFFEVNANFLDENYYSVAYVRHEELPGLWKFATTEEEYRAEQKRVAHQDRLKDVFVMNASIGKMIYMKWGSLNFNLSVSNLLNNRNIQMSGYQQNKLDYTDYNINKYPNRVMYAQGIKFYFNVGVRF